MRASASRSPARAMTDETTRGDARGRRGRRGARRRVSEARGASPPAEAVMSSFSV
ncbi:uncharacterized protein MICPUCDRAFT_67904 [Micromonas pusilla CCMP1545]|uniref:Predicted protein n=1 Tax=Micromonas pusilla (strain CCMP1545) TaxID=564608 RepID=C1MSN3_MICPC|nr:uncharacterized protein MICPUCDRAFT_67904 [Micromonas pusilla CCMP1545]EEH56812.1 predicted protein [Micromonas pusilla CCMP1545]|eukprot:XP_003058357.1 predicted protein [Micromonas pusilla CCMP1545]